MHDSRQFDTCRSFQLLDITVAQCETKIDPDRMLDDFGWKTIA
jgi:hypothetical protein